MTGSACCSALCDFALPSHGRHQMDPFTHRLKSHIEHVKRVGIHCNSEETTKQALILPLLDILGFNPYDPTKVLAEYCADMRGVKASERVDYALYCNGQPVMFVEAKAYKEKLANHAPQLARYFNSTIGVTIAAITNGKEWRFFTDLIHANVMDEAPFLIIDFMATPCQNYDQLQQFAHDHFQAARLRSFAEESHYIQTFKGVIHSSLTHIDHDFVRYVAGKSHIQRPLTVKYLDSLTPMVQTATEHAMSEIIVQKLAGANTVTTIQTVTAAPIIPPDRFIDPHNPKIITTKIEMRLFEIIKDLLPDQEIYAKDTESYYSILYQNKNNRWLLRYFGDKKQPTIQFIVPITNVRRVEIKRAGLSFASNDHVYLEKPDHLIRIMSVLMDCLRYCQNDDNFRKKTEDDLY
jgi:hypothetical protein